MVLSRRSEYLIKNMEEEIKKILEKNLELNEEIREMMKGIKRYIMWQRVWGVIKIIIIIGPIIVGLIYLPPLIKDALGQYQNLLGISAGNTQLGPGNLGSLSPALLEMLK